MFKVILYSTVSFFLFSLNIAVADEGEVERLAVPEYHDAPPAEMTGELGEPQMPTEQMPSEMMPESEDNQEYVEASQEENTRDGNPNMNDEEGNVEETTPPLNSGEEPTAPNQEQQSQVQEGDPAQENEKSQETLSAEEAEAKHAEEVELREVGAGEDEVMQ